MTLGQLVHQALATVVVAAIVTTMARKRRHRYA
jgi:hypothetical protein